MRCKIFCCLLFLIAILFLYFFSHMSIFSIAWSILIFCVQIVLFVSIIALGTILLKYSVRRAEKFHTQLDDLRKSATIVDATALFAQMIFTLLPLIGIAALLWLVNYFFASWWVTSYLAYWAFLALLATQLMTRKENEGTEGTFINLVKAAVAVHVGYWLYLHYFV